MLDLHNASPEGRRQMHDNWLGQYHRAETPVDREIVRVKFFDAGAVLVPLRNVITKQPILDKEGKVRTVRFNPMFNARMARLLASTKPDPARPKMATVDIAFELLLNSVFLAPPTVRKFKGARAAKGARVAQR